MHHWLCPPQLHLGSFTLGESSKMQQVLDRWCEPAAATAWMFLCCAVLQADFSLDGKNLPISIQHLNRGHCTARVQFAQSLVLLQCHYIS